jgi:hypothetical protein
MIRELVDAAFREPRTRAEALAYFESAASLPVHRGTALLRRIADEAGARDEDAMRWSFSDAARHDTTRYEPSFAITFAYAALRMCRAAGHDGDALDECLERVAGGDVAFRGGR